MTRLINRAEIGSTFQALDTHIDVADSFANVRDLQKLRLNHNTLLAERARRPAVSQVCVQSDSTNYILISGHGSTSYLPVAIDTTVMFSQQTKTATFKMRAASTSASLDVFVYPELIRPSGAGSLARPEITVTGNTEASYSATVPLPAQDEASTRFGMRPLRFRVTLRAELNFPGSPKVSAGAIYAVGPNWIHGGTNVTVGDDIWFSDADIERRRITAVYANTANATPFYGIFADRAWNKLPTTSNTYSSDVNVSLALYTWSLYEDNVTDFESTPGGV